MPTNEMDAKRPLLLLAVGPLTAAAAELPAAGRGRLSAGGGFLLATVPAAPGLLLTRGTAR